MMQSTQRPMETRLMTRQVFSPAFSQSPRCVKQRRQTQSQSIQIVAAATLEAPSKPASKEADFTQAMGILKEAANKRTPPARLVLEAMLKLEKQRLQIDSLPEVLGGGKEGKRWELVFVSGSKDVQKATKGQPAGGSYNPIPAAQWWNKETATIENGVYLGPILALVFAGPYEIAKNKLTFDFDKLKVRLGPKWFQIPLGTMKTYTKSKSNPFFLFAYADEDLVVGRGKGGGLALWKRTTPTWELKNSVGVYKE